MTRTQKKKKNYYIYFTILDLEDQIKVLSESDQLFII